MGTQQPLEDPLKRNYDQEHEFYYDKANVLAEAERYHEALEAYRRAIQIKPDFEWAYGNMAIALEALGRFEEALGAIDTALQMNPSDKDYLATRQAIMAAMSQDRQPTMSRQAATNGLFKALLSFDGPHAMAMILAGADVRATDPQGNTPLHHCFRCPDLALAEQLVEALVSRGAEMNVVNAVGDSPWVKLQGIRNDRHRTALSSLLVSLGAKEDQAALMAKKDRIAKMRSELTERPLLQNELPDSSPQETAMSDSRGRRQIALLLCALSLACVALGGVVVLAGAWPMAKAWVALSTFGGVAILSGVYVFARGTLPNTQDVMKVVAHIAEVRDCGVDQKCESYKGKLRFFLPPDWRREKAGKGGWLIYPRGLGVPLIFSVWALDADPAFEDSSPDGLARNAEDLGHRHGFRLIHDSVRPCEVAGQKAIEYELTAGGKRRVLGYLWRYEGGDYEFLVEACSPDHLRMIRPAVDEFLQGVFMW